MIALSAHYPADGIIQHGYNGGQDNALRRNRWRVR
jgi:hypothetical protein